MDQYEHLSGFCLFPENTIHGVIITIQLQTGLVETFLGWSWWRLNTNPLLYIIKRYSEKKGRSFITNVRTALRDRFHFLDTGFCVLLAIIKLKMKGVFAAVVIKKWRYWPKYIEGNETKSAKESEAIGTQSILPGTLLDVPFDVFTSHKPDYFMIFMSTYGTIEGRRNKKIKRMSKAGWVIE